MKVSVLQISLHCCYLKNTIVALGKYRKNFLALRAKIYWKSPFQDHSHNQTLTKLSMPEKLTILLTTLIYWYQMHKIGKRINIRQIYQGHDKNPGLCWVTCIAQHWFQISWFDLKILSRESQNSAAIEWSIMCMSNEATPPSPNLSEILRYHIRHVWR